MSNNSLTPQDAATLPRLRTLQLGSGENGDATETVNLFRGEVSFPLELVSLVSRGGLSARIVATYQSDVLEAVDTWNLESPTGILGVGWDLNFQKIIRETSGLVGGADDTYFLLGPDGVSRLFPIERTEIVWRFESESYDFSVIEYEPALERWKIRTTDGIVREYGGAPNALEHGVLWGNAKGGWQDASIRLASQSQFVTAWDLSAIRNRWNDAITFEYTEFPDDEIRVGANGLTYTRARYLSVIREPAGRAITLTYANKESSDTVEEYIPPHSGPKSTKFSAYQDRYETRYLDAITVTQLVDGTPAQLLSLRFAYEIADNSAASEAPRAKMMKRYLRSITTVHQLGVLGDTLRFDYYSALEASSNPSAQRGALKTLTYPQGGTATYRYSRRSIGTTGLARTLTLSDTGAGIPRIWYGPTYAVVARFNAGEGQLLCVTVVEWNGSWLLSQPIRSFIPGGLDFSSLTVDTYEEHFILSFRKIASVSDRYEVHAVRRRFGRYGEWDDTQLETPLLPFAAAELAIATGPSFVALAVDGLASVLSYVWHRSTRTWEERILRLAAAGEFALAGSGSVFVVCRLTSGIGRARLSLFHLDPISLQWAETLLDDATMTWEGPVPRASLSVEAGMAVATFVTSVDDGAHTFKYDVRTYLWDAEYSGIFRFVRKHANVPDSTSLPVLQSGLSGSLVANAGDLFRFDGNVWIQGSVGSLGEDGAAVRLAIGYDLTAIQTAKRRAIVAFDPWIDNFRTLRDTARAQGPEYPTVRGNYVSLGTEILYLNPDGTLENVGVITPGDREVASAAPGFLVYGDSRGRSYAQCLRNGALRGANIPLEGRAFVEKPDSSGQDLVGDSAFCTFEGPSFAEATNLTFHRVLRGAVTGLVWDWVVAALDVSDGLGSTQTTTYEQKASGTTGPLGLAAQYTQVLSGITVPNADGFPFGYTISHFFDGLAPDPDDPNPYAQLNGMLSSRESYDASGLKVRTESWNWQIVRQAVDARTGRERDLFGFYLQLESRSETISPRAGASLSRRVHYVYDPASGQVRSVAHENVTGSGQRQFLKETYQFAYEVYPSLAMENLLFPIALKTETVDDIPVGITATLWAVRSQRPVLAPSSDYVALSVTATLSAAQWHGESPVTLNDWRLTGSTIKRDDFGNELERTDEQGVVHSFIYDLSASLVLAEFENASRVGQQATYLGFEKDEGLDGWSLGGSAEALQAAIIDTDAIVGARSLRLDGVVGALALTRRLDIKSNRAETYLVSCWVKTLPDFSSPDPNARLEAQAGSTTAGMEIPGTAGEWQFIHIVIAVPAESAVVISLSNTSGKTVLVDSIRFAPVVGAFSGRAFDQRTRLPFDTCKETGSVQRVRLGSGEKQFAEVDSDALVKVRYDFFSTAGNDRRFSQNAPGESWSILPQSWGVIQSFTLGEQWANGWTVAEPDRWTTRGGRLHHLRSDRDQITFDNVPAGASDFGISVRAHYASLPQVDMGLVVDGRIELRWSMAKCRWTLHDTVARTFFDGPLRTLASLSESSYAAALDAKTLPPELLQSFAIAGLPLSSMSTVVVRLRGQRWAVVDGSGGPVYEVVLDSDEPAWLRVVTQPRTWTLLILGSRVVVLADGGRVMSVDLLTPITGSPGLEAAGDVSFDNVAIFSGPRISLSIQDALGRAVESQINEGNTQVVAANFYDQLGRMVLETRRARLEREGDQIFRPVPNLAQLDWSTLILSGVVADANPDAGGFAYSRTRFESSPLGRIVERGAPGADFAIPPQGAGHTKRVVYGVSDGAFGLPAGGLFQRTDIDQDNGEVISFTDRRGQNVCTAVRLSDAANDFAITRRAFSPAGRLLSTEQPMGWIDVAEYDFVGQKTMETLANSGRSRFIYDTWARLRFWSDARGDNAPTPYVHFRKYDALGRTVAEGCFDSAWTPDLVAHRDNADWPPATASRVYEFDGPIATSLLGLGKRSADVCQNQLTTGSGSDPVVVRREYLFDIYSGLINQTTFVAAYGPARYETTFEYNNLGQARVEVRPDPSGARGLVIATDFDAVGRVAQISLDDVPRLIYSYTQNGKLATRHCLRSAGPPMVEQWTHTPTGWIKAIDGPGLVETIEHTAGAINGGGYYTGRPARLTTAARADAETVVLQTAYNRSGGLAGIRRSQGGNVLELSYCYDRNGNPKKLGTRFLQYDPASRDRLVGWTDDPVSAVVQSDPDGNVVGVTGSPALWTLAVERFDYAPLQWTPATGSNVENRFSTDGLRIYTEQTNGGVVQRRLTLRDPAGAIVFDIDNTGRRAEYIYGPFGIDLARVDGATYFISRDHLGSVRGVVDEQGTLVNCYDYAPFGQIMPRPTSPRASVQPFRFVSREALSANVYDLEARLYDAATGRFLSPDPDRQFASPYVYVGNDPLSQIDPTGKIAPLLVALIVGAIVGAAAGTVAAVITIVQNDLEGGEAAGVFFGTFFLSAAAGAGTAFVGGLPLAIAADTAVAAAVSAATIVTGVVAGAGFSAAEAAGEAALRGDDPGEAAWKAAIIGGASEFSGGVVGELSLPLMKWATRNLETTWGSGMKRALRQEVVAGTLGGLASGAVGAGVGAALSGEDGADGALDVLRGAAFGLLGGAARGIESINYLARFNRNTARMQADLDAHFGAIEMDDFG